MKRENWELAIINYPKIFLYWKMQLQITMAIFGINKCTLHGHENHKSFNCFRWWPTLSRLSLAFPCIPDDSVRLCNWLLFEFWNKRTRTHTRTHTHSRTRTRPGDNLQNNISTELNILKCAHDFLKSMLCLAYILELKSKKCFGTHGHNKEQFHFSKVCSD